MKFYYSFGSLCVISFKDNLRSFNVVRSVPSVANDDSLGSGVSPAPDSSPAQQCQHGKTCQDKGAVGPVDRQLFGSARARPSRPKGSNYEQRRVNFFVPKRPFVHGRN